MTYIQSYFKNNNGGSGNVQSGHLAFGTLGSERLRITSAGDVGIGTSDPSEAFEVVETSPTIKARATGNSRSGKLAVDNSRAEGPYWWSDPWSMGW